MKNIAIIGAGFAGLAAAFFLAEEFQVSLFDKKGIGKGASGASCGLMHPYPGEKGKRSWFAQEAIEESLSLLKIVEEEVGRPVANYNGILRNGPCLNPGLDVDVLGENRYLIRSGVTVFANLYLEGLWKACEKKGVKLYVQDIDSLEQLSSFDRVVLTAGFGIKNFVDPKEIGINFVKGQALVCWVKERLERSVSQKHYIAVTENPLVVHFGATYERENVDEIPCLKTAVELLLPELEVVDVRCGVRVTNRAHYFPILKQLNEKTWTITALGSRGLLYHAYMAKKLKETLLK